MADFDGDGDNDLFACFGSGVANRIYFNEQDGTLQESPHQYGVSAGGPPAAGDIDHDGDLDVVVPCGMANEVWLNDGSGHFTVTEQEFESLNSYCVKLVDLDADGDLDAIFGNNGPNSIWFNDGQGRFENVQWLGSERAKELTKSIGAADLNGDDLIDFFVAITGHPDRIYLQQSHSGRQVP